ncbi:MAG: MFS transporter [Pseudomonadota bacterium]
MTTDWRLIALLFITGLFAAAQFAKIALTLEPLAASYPGAPLPWIVSALSLAGILFGVTAGMVVARFGARRVLLLAILGAAMASAAQAMLPAFPVLVALRLAEGITHLAMVVAAPTLMAAVAAPADKPVAMGLWGTFFGVGFAAAAAVIPLLSGPSTVFIAHALGLLILAAALWPMLPRGVARDTGQGGFVARHVAIYTNPRLLAPALGFIWHTITFLGLLTFLPRVIGGWTAPVLPLVALVGTFGAGVLARRIAPRQLLVASFVLSIAGLLAAIALPETLRIWLILPLFVILGLVPGASFANVPALNPDPADQARANGAVAQLGNVGTACSTPLFAAALTYGFTGLALTAAAMFAAGLGAVWLIHRNISEST